MWTRNPNSRLVSIPRAAVMLGVCQRTLIKAITRGEIRVTELLERRYIPRSEIERLTKGQK
jgi:hypothetical protein